MGANNADFTEHFKVAQDYKNYTGKAVGTIRAGDLLPGPHVQYFDAEGVGEDAEQVMARKLRSAKSNEGNGFGGGVYGKDYDSLQESIRKHGVKGPVSLSFPDEHSVIVHGGHHRIAAAADLDPDMQIPWKPGIPGIPEKYDNSNCPHCGGNGMEPNHLKRMYARLDNYGEEFIRADVKDCPTCNGNGVV